MLQLNRSQCDMRQGPSYLQGTVYCIELKTSLNNTTEEGDITDCRYSSGSKYIHLGNY